MELLAVYNEEGTQTGERVERTAAHRNGILHGASHTFIYRKQNGALQILLQRRSPQKDSFPGCLDISSAGHVEAGMDFDDTAVKEIREELGLSVAPEALTPAFMQRYSSTDEFRGEIFRNEEIDRVYLLEADPPLSGLRLQEEEVSEVLWMDLREAQDRIRAGDKEICIDPEEMERVCRAIAENGKF